MSADAPELPIVDAFGRPFETPEHRSRYAAKLAWEAIGVSPFGHAFDASAMAADISNNFDAWDGKPVTIAGRVMAKRGQGKAAFLDLQDRSGRIQLFASIDQLGDEGLDRLVRWIHAGDYLGITGEVFRTKRGEISIRVDKYDLLSKALNPMPEKWHGLQDIEIRYRKRYLDLISNEESRRILLMRSRLVRAVREFLWSRDYVEVEVPVLTDIASGAAARPFNTHHNALDWDLHLRISLELPLKKAMIGGIDRVFEIGRVFRNEGIDRDHSPEFTMLECYQAFSDYEGMMELVESMFHKVALDVLGTAKVQLPEMPEVDLTPPWPRRRYHELLREYAGFELTSETTVEDLKAAIRRHGFDDSDVATKGRGIDVLFSKTVEDHLPGPVFVLDYPIELSPLARRIPGQEHLTYRFEAFLYGMEMGNAFTELNDPEDQRRRFTHQSEERAAGDDEAMPIDEDFIEAMSHGMPPAGGLGIGIDRMAMVFAGANNLRDVILFPLLKEQAMENATRSDTPLADLFHLIEQGMAAHGISPGKLMKEAEVAKSDFNGWKKGERIPDTDQLKRLAELLHLPLSQLTELANQAHNQMTPIGPEDAPPEPQSPESGDDSA